MGSQRSADQEQIRIVDDAQLLQRFADGDRDALADFVRRWETPMLRIAYRIVGQVADAEEVRQTVLLRMVQNPARVAQTRNVAGWVRRCIMNEAITLLRKRERIRGEPLPPGVVCAPEHEVEDDVSSLLRDAMRTLDPNTRGMLSLRFDDRLTIREIAEVLKMPHTTVHSQLQSAIRALRIQLNSLSR